ncbi:hypothetical protein C1645_820398 [Glomus cerebriforme]|uniref:Uncharacterized protein n=1 Tax=Glomus cerebriforme TaxID=658196 RepID=A0A397T5R0_9GLOM|nr:hypothetical protein C1645_820398 [Glomus cerebriforme]
MPNFCSQSALMVAKSESIVRRLNNEYPVLSQLFAYNREGTIGFLKANGGLYGFNLSHDFDVPHSGNNNYKTWSDYRDAIERYLEKICENVKAIDPIRGDNRSFKEELRPARKVLSDEIHMQHYIKFPFWPSVGDQQESHVELDTGDHYDSGAYIVIWSCVGWIKVTDRRPQNYRYIAEFSGRPDIKLLVFDNDRLKELECTIKTKVTARGGVNGFPIQFGSTEVTQQLVVVPRLRKKRRITGITERTSLMYYRCELNSQQDRIIRENFTRHLESSDTEDDRSCKCKREDKGQRNEDEIELLGARSIVASNTSSPSFSREEKEVVLKTKKHQLKLSTSLINISEKDLVDPINKVFSNDDKKRMIEIWEEMESSAEEKKNSVRRSKWEKSIKPLIEKYAPAVEKKSNSIFDDDDQLQSTKIIFEIPFEDEFDLKKHYDMLWTQDIYQRL